MGEVWATILHGVYIALADAYDWTWLFEDPSQTAGNSIFFHLVFDTLIDLPCNPTCKLLFFLSTHSDPDTERTVTMARDAMINADGVRYNHTNECLLWKAFAKRGLGFNADNYINDYSILPECP